MNTILKIHTKTDVFYACPPPAIEQSRNSSANAVAWAKEVFKDVTLVQFVRKRPDTLMCLIDIDKFAIPMWEFTVFVNDVKPEDFNDELIEQVETWLDTRIHNMLHWAERKRKEYTMSTITKIIVTNIQWDAPEDENLPEEVVIAVTPETAYLLEDIDGYADNLSDYLSDTYEYCHTGFAVTCE